MVGVVSVVGCSIGGLDQCYVLFIQIDVVINQGNLGGLLFNICGEVVGINLQIFFVLGGYMGISFVILIDLVMGVVEQIKIFGWVSCGQLGVVVELIDGLKVQGLGLFDSCGVLVNQIVFGSVVVKVGVEIGDVICFVNGSMVNVWLDLLSVIGVLLLGSKVCLGVVCDGKECEFIVILIELVEDVECVSSCLVMVDVVMLQIGVNVLLGLEVIDLIVVQCKQLGLEFGEGVCIIWVIGQVVWDVQLLQGMVILQVGCILVGSVVVLDCQLLGYKKGDVVMLLVCIGVGNSVFVVIKMGQ